MKKKFLITSLLAGTFLLSACGNKKPELPEGELGGISMNEETEETKETEIKSEISEKISESNNQSDIDTSKIELSDLYNIGSSIVTINGKTTIILGNNEQNFNVSVDKDLGQALYDAKDIIMVYPVFENDEQYMKENENRMIISYVMTLHEEEMLAMVEENDYSITDEMAIKAKELLSEEELKELEKTIEETNDSCKILTNYICYNKEGKCLGKLTAEEINKILAEKDAAIEERKNSAEKIKNEVSASTLLIEKDYCAEGDITLINDTSRNIKVTATFINFFGEYEDEVFFIPSNVLGTNQKISTSSDNGESFNDGTIVVISDTTNEDILANIDDDEVIKVSTMTKSEKISAFAYDFIYNDTDAAITMYAATGDSITVEAGEIVGMSWVGLDEIWFE